MNRSEMLRLVVEDPQVAADGIAVLTAVLANHEGDDGLALSTIVEPATESPERAGATLLFVSAIAAAMLGEYRAAGIDPNRWLQRCAARYQEQRG